MASVATVQPWYAPRIAITSSLPVAVRASRIASSTDSEPVLTRNTVSSGGGKRAASASANATIGSYRNRELVLSSRSWRATAASTAGWLCPRTATLLTMSTRARPRASTRWCRQPRSIRGGASK